MTHLVKNEDNKSHSFSINICNAIPEILFVVMGEARFFPQWYEFLRDTNSSIVQVTFLYGSYDIPISQEPHTKQCERARQTNEFVDCKLRYIPNTTWTIGRNLLAGEGLILEKDMGRKFDFWVFSDDDAIVRCPQYFERSGQRKCWQGLVESIGRAREISSKITTIAPAYYAKTDGWFGVSTQDAMIAAFPRHSVPYLLPYAVPPKGHSEWLSQAALFCVMRSCFPSSVIAPPHYTAQNPLHREYSKANFSAETILETVRNNYGNYANFERCSEMVFRQEQDKIGPFGSEHELLEHIPDPNLSHCSGLQHRFSEWETRILNEAHNS